MWPVRVVVRADASAAQGAGHVMRCLTLAEELSGRGHEVLLAVSVEGIPWLSERVAAAGLESVPATAGAVDVVGLSALKPDWVVIDLPSVDVHSASDLAARLPVLLITDGQPPAVQAALFLEQNLGAEVAAPPTGTLLAGPRYALVRRAIRDRRRPDPWNIVGVPRVLAVMGGTDPTGAIVEVARRLAGVDAAFEATVVTTDGHRAAVDAALAGRAHVTVASPSGGLDGLLADADVVVCAGGTSLWDVATLGIPVIALAVVENQRASVRGAVAAGIALGVDAAEDPSAFDAVGGQLERLLTVEVLRRDLSERAAELFDGLGPSRVADAMEAGA